MYLYQDLRGTVTLHVKMVNIFIVIPIRKAKAKHSNLEHKRPNKP